MHNAIFRYLFVIYSNLFYLILVVVFLVCFSIFFCFYWCFKPFSQQLVPFAGSAFFLKVALTFLGYVTEQAMVCSFWWKRHCNSIMHLLFQSTFHRLWTGNFLLKKCCIRLLRFFTLGLHKTLVWLNQKSNTDLQGYR